MAWRWFLHRSNRPALLSTKKARYLHLLTPWESLPPDRCGVDHRRPCTAPRQRHGVGGPLPQENVPSLSYPLRHHDGAPHLHLHETSNCGLGHSVPVAPKRKVPEHPRLHACGGAPGLAVGCRPARRRRRRHAGRRQSRARKVGSLELAIVQADTPDCCSVSVRGCHPGPAGRGFTAECACIRRMPWASRWQPCSQDGDRPLEMRTLHMHICTH